VKLTRSAVHLTKNFDWMNNGFTQIYWFGIFSKSTKVYFFFPSKIRFSISFPDVNPFQQRNLRYFSLMREWWGIPHFSSRVFHLPQQNHTTTKTPLKETKIKNNRVRFIGWVLIKSYNYLIWPSKQLFGSNFENK